MAKATLLEDYAAYLNLYRSNNTEHAYLVDVRQCLIWLRDHELLWNDENVQKWLASLRVSDRTRARKIAALRSFAHFAQWPLTIETIHYPQALPIVPSVEEVQALLGQLPLADRVIVELLYATGMRVSELVRMTWGDIRWDVQTILVHGKGSKDRMVIFPDSTAVLLREWHWHRHQPSPDEEVIGLRRETVTRRLARYGIYPHLMRHACATHCLEGGMDLRAIQEMLGHASLRTVEIYTRISPQHLQESYRRAHPLATF